MKIWQTRSNLARTTLAVAVISVAAGPFHSTGLAAPCKPPKAMGYLVEFPQGQEAPIKLYKSNKGGRLGSVPAAQVVGKLQLCSPKIGSVNEVRLSKDVLIQLENGKSGATDGRYWVRDNQVRFESLTADNSKKFACERNQVKTRVAGGAAGGEACKE